MSKYASQPIGTGDAATLGGHPASYFAVAGGGGSMIYPGAGIAVSTGFAWGPSIMNNSANWNTAFGWGNHASAGYAPLASPTFTGGIIVNGTADQIKIQSYTTSGKYWRLGTDIGPAGANRNFSIYEDDFGNALTILQSNGNVGIGTTAPSEKLHVAGNGIFTGDIVCYG